MLGRTSPTRAAYETSRVHLVALACEIVVLVALIDRELARISGSPGVEEISNHCREHRGAADRLLSAEPAVEAPSFEDLGRAIDEFCTRVADVRRHWECIAETHPPKARRRPHFPGISLRVPRWS